MKASELLRELDGARNGDWFRDGQLQPNGHLAWRAVHLLPLIADCIEAAESVYADNEDGEIGIALWPVLTALTAALQPPTEGSPPPPEGATAPTKAPESKPHSSPSEIEAANEYERRIAWTMADRVANVQRWLPTDDVSTARRDLARLVEQLEAAHEALRQIAYDGPNPCSRRSAELQWASDIARASLASNPAIVPATDRPPAASPASDRFWSADYGQAALEGDTPR